MVDEGKIAVPVLDGEAVQLDSSNLVDTRHYSTMFLGDLCIHEPSDLSDDNVPNLLIKFSIKAKELFLSMQYFTLSLNHSFLYIVLVTLTLI